MSSSNHKGFAPHLINFLCFALVFQICNGLEVFQEKRIVNSSELCIIPITPALFNWETSPESVNEIEYSARTSHSPNLPNWLRYTYNGSSSTGFLYGVPPEEESTVSLDVIAWNHYDNYDVRLLIISMEIVRRRTDVYTVELKIDNMNARDLCERKGMLRVLNIFSRYLNWTYSDGGYIHPIFLASAVELGENRIPLRPSDAEGVVLRLASDRNFSKALEKLEEEVFKLPKLRPCPRGMKKTSMEKYFRSQNVQVDWCSFKLRDVSNPIGNANDTTTTAAANPATINSPAADGEAVKHISSSGIEDGLEDIFHFRTQIPEKSYGSGILLATVVPGAIGGLMGFLLMVLLWGDREEDVVDGDGLFYEAAFRELIAFFSRFQKQSKDEETEDRSLSNEPEGFVGIITRDRAEPEENFGRDAIHTPLPPQYGERETHPNGSPALIYAV